VTANDLQPVEDSLSFSSIVAEPSKRMNCIRQMERRKYVNHFRKLRIPFWRVTPRTPRQATIPVLERQVSDRIWSTTTC